MKRLLGVAAILLAIGSSLVAFNQPSRGYMILAATTPPPAYVGPGDITATFTVWYGLRAYTAAIAAAGTQPLVNMTRASDSHACDVLPATNGGLGVTGNCGTGGDNGQSASSFCNATSCSIKAYDQTGGNHCGGLTCDLTTNSNAGAATSFPTLSFNCINTSLPCWLSNSTPGQDMESANNFTSNAARQVSVSLVAWNSGSGTAFFLAQNGANNFLSWSGANTWTWFGGNSGSVAATLTDSAFHAGNLAIDLTTNTSTFNGDGTETTSTNVNNFVGAGPIEVARQTSSGTAQQVEGGFADATVWTLSIRSKLCWNQSQYWGTTAGTHCNSSGT